MIDPQSQANFWIKNMENKNLLTIDPLTEKVGDKLKNSIIDGISVLYQNVGEEIDPILDGILIKSIRKMPNGKQLIHMGGSDIPYNPDFRFYITTK